MPNDAVNTFSGAVAAFESSAPWLTPVHMPALITLRKLAESLDNGDLTPALVAQFGLTYRNLAKLAPSTPTKADPLAEALAKAGAG